MQRILTTISLLAASALTLLGQGRVNFNNYVSGNAITLMAWPEYFPLPQPSYAGASFSIQLLWSLGTFPDYLSFQASNPSSSVPVAFFGTMGGSPATDGAGLFDGGTVETGPAGQYTMLARGWYNGGQYPTYASALNTGHAGQSQLFTIVATVSPTPPPNTMFPSFSIGIPEPSTFALVGLCVTAFLVFRRGK